MEMKLFDKNKLKNLMYLQIQKHDVVISDAIKNGSRKARTGDLNDSKRGNKKRISKARMQKNL